MESGEKSTGKCNDTSLTCGTDFAARCYKRSQVGVGGGLNVVQEAALRFSSRLLSHGIFALMFRL